MVFLALFLKLKRVVSEATCFFVGLYIMSLSAEEKS